MQRPNDLGLLVILGGPGGTGSSTIAKILAKKWELHRIDAGEIMRNKNSNKDLSVYLSGRVSKHPEIDQEIDRFLVRMSYYPNIMIESKFFAAIATLLGIPCTIKIWIDADITTRVYRILEREERLKDKKIVNPDDPLFIKTKDKLQRRLASDRKRCKKLYHADLEKPEELNDIVLDTTGLNIPFTMKKLFQEIRESDELKKRFDPKLIKY